MTTIMNLEELQENIGFLDSEQGIVYLSLVDTDLWELLEQYVYTVDYRLYFDFANRIVIGKYAKMVSTSKLSLLKKSIYYALKGEEYNLKTLINTTNLDYNPLENYELHENIVTTASIAGNIKYGEFIINDAFSKDPITNTNKESHGEFVEEILKDLPERQSKTIFSKGERVESVNDKTTFKTEDQTNNETDTTEYGFTSESKVDTKILGKRDSTSNTESKISAYDTSAYQPDNTSNTTNVEQSVTDKDTIDTTQEEHTDTTTKNSTIGAKNETTEKNVTTTTDETADTEITTLQAYNDTDTHTHKAHDIDYTTNLGAEKTTNTRTNQEHETTNTEDSDKKVERDLHGRYGFNTVQTMIESERRLANLNISDKIIDIVVHTICEGVLYLW